MPEWAVALIEQNPDTFIRVVAVVIAVIAVHGIWQVIRRSNKDAELIRRTLERREERVNVLEKENDELEEDITENTVERWKLIAQVEQLRADLEHCQGILKNGGLSAQDAQTYRSMIVRQQTIILELEQKVRDLGGEP